MWILHTRKYDDSESRKWGVECVHVGLREWGVDGCTWVFIFYLYLSLFLHKFFNDDFMSTIKVV
jgi:hypothetical protein